MRKLLSCAFFGLVFMVTLAAGAQTEAESQATATSTSPAPPPTSREIPFDLVFSYLPFGSTQTITVQVWDAATGGALLFCPPAVLFLCPHTAPPPPLRGLAEQASEGIQASRGTC
jgi:hypothetical protein